jgi:hypothetical protein
MLPDFSTIHAPTQLDLDPLSWGKLNPTLTHVAKLQEVLCKEVRSARAREQAPRRFMQERM